MDGFTWFMIALGAVSLIAFGILGHFIVKEWGKIVAGWRKELP